MPSKEELRHKIWTRMVEQEVGAFPFPLEGRIPNFKGSNEAAKKAAGLDAWKAASHVKANPDSPQLKLRELAMADGKRLFMAVPRLRDENPFREIVPDSDTRPARAVSIKGSRKYGQPRSVSDLPEIDLIVTGSVAVHPDGRRLGKGGGYSDLEFALLQEFGKVTTDTVIMTTVHPLQIIKEDIPFRRHDIPVDYIVTANGVTETDTSYDRPKGVIKELLSPEYLQQIPALESWGGEPS